MSDIDSISLTVWQQAIIDKSRTVTVDGEAYPVRSTPKMRLKQIDFRLEGREIRGLEQNPKTKSRWAAMARKGQKVMQFLKGGRYIAVVADGKVRNYLHAWRSK